MNFMFRHPHPLTCKLWTTLSNPCNKVRGKYIWKEVFLRLCPCVCLIIVSLWCCRWLYNNYMLNWIIYIKMDLALNNLQRLICHKTQQTNKPNQGWSLTNWLFSVISRSHVASGGLHLCRNIVNVFSSPIHVSFYNEWLHE